MEFFLEIIGYRYFLWRGNIFGLLDSVVKFWRTENWKCMACLTKRGTQNKTGEIVWFPGACDDKYELLHCLDSIKVVSHKKSEFKIEL